MVRAMEMDMVGAVALDKESHSKIFSQVQPKKYLHEFDKLKSNHRRVLNLSTLERKEKLIGYLNE